MRQRLLFVRPVLVIGGCWLLLGQGPARAQHPNVARGFTPSGMFDTGGIDVVNGFNGNLLIRIPIGGSYPVGGTMGSYSFSLMYNSKPWDFTARNGVACPGNNNIPTDTLAVASPYDNAGLGWRFSLGRLGGDLLPYGAPPAPSLIAYRGTDGSEHYLFDRLTTGQGGSVQQAGILFSNDGSYLRFGPNGVEFPDGSVHVFNSNGYPTSIKERFGNGLTIDYTTDPQTCPGNVWQIHDGFRTHKVCFRPTGYTAPEQTEVVDHIELAGFSGTSTYRFLYNDADASGNGFHEVSLTGYGTDIRGCLDPPWQQRVYLLTKLLLPDGTSYSMPVANYTQTYPGLLTAMHLPTSGSIAWDYTLTPLPQPHSDENGLWYIPVQSFVVAVSKRSLYDSAGHLVGNWLYSAANVGFLANELVNQVVFPSADPVLASQGATGHRVVTYYSACVYGSCLNEAGAPDPPDTYSVDYALPYSRRRPDGTGRFLSQEIYAAGASTPLRRIYLAYDNDAAPNPPPTLASPLFVNQRLQSQRTVYQDDPLPGTTSNFTAVITDSSNYDGLGHYRTVNMSDNTGFGTQRTERIDWNPGGLPGPGDPWILDTYDFREQQEGSNLERQETVFEPGTRFLLCQRRLKGGANRGSSDVVVTYAHGDPQAPGQVTAESWYGGDTQALPAASTCGSLPANPVYSYSHAYTAGVRNSTTVQVSQSGGGTSRLKMLDDDVDPGSGLVSTARDPAGRPIAFIYDSMGRPSTVAPQGDATTRFTYQLSDTSPPFIDRKVGSPGLEEQTWQLDALGRTVAQTVVMPNNASTTSVVTLNAMGWKTFETEPAANPGANGTRYLNYDPFGRPGRIVAADGKTTYLDYHGARVVVRTQRVWNGTREIPVSTREEYDGLGRLRRIQDPNGIWTRYRYNVEGRLTTVTTNGGQPRNFNYDGRGFLTAEQDPESGLTAYQYDAKGNVTRKATPTGTLRSAYDEAGRLVSVITPQAAQKQFSYGTGTEAGKLKQSRAFNWRMGSTCSATEVRQDFSYDPATGRLATENTSLWQGTAQQLESWTQSYAYDGAGRTTRVTYPNCVSLCSSTPRQVTTAYSSGRPTSVSGFANAITYNANGTLATIQHANGVVFTETPDPKGMVRVGSLRADSPSGHPWPREDYFYDSAGNIKAIGGKTYAYDAGSRIVSATVPTAGAQPYQAFTYDAFGNLTSLYRGANPINGTYINYTPDPATNRLQGATYDGSGNLLAYQGSTYTWDALGQAASINTGAEVWTHAYDAAGERVWSFRTAPSRLDNYALRGNDSKLLSVFTKTGSTYSWEDYAYREGLLLGAAFSNGRVVHFDVDHLGSVRLETDVTAGATYRDFWPYGEEATPPGGSERMKLAGQERDLGNLTSTADDIDYMHARYYRPLYARFLSADRHNGSPLAPQTWNRYSYTAGNPLRYTDPTGEYLCSDTSLCKQFEEARQEILQSGMASETLKATAAAYGDLGADNGITVKLGDPGEGNDAATVVKSAKPQFHLNANQELETALRATVLVRPGLRGIGLEASAAHEGSHIVDLQAFVASFDKQGNSKAELNILTGESERRAYGMSAELAKLTGQTIRYNGGTFKPTMTRAEVDREVQRVLSALKQKEPNERLFAWP